MKKERESNFELLRGVLMFMVVGLHVIGLGVLDLDSPVPYGELNFYQGNLLESFFVMAVDCFVIISGYFSLRSTFEKYLKFYLPIFLYSIFFYLVFSVCISGVNFLLLVKSFFLFITNEYWFVTTYILLYIISPLLNRILAGIAKREMEITLCLGIFLFVLIPSFTPFSFTNDRGFGIINFILLYFTGFYIRHFYSLNMNKNWYLFLYILSCLSIFLANVLMAHYFGYNKGWKSRFYAYDFLGVYLSAIFLFLYFKNLNIRSRLINYCSISFFYIYIIHENPYVRDVLYKFLKCPEYYYSNYWLLHSVLCIVLIFLICLLVDILRRLLFDGIQRRVIDKFVEVVNILQKAEHRWRK